MEASRVDENRVRRMAARQGLVVNKSRRRDPNALDYGRYWIVEPRRNVIATSLEGQEHGITLEEVEAWLRSPRSERLTSPLVERGSDDA